MSERAYGTILRVRPLSETSVIVHWLSREQGRMAVVAKGARRPKSPFLGRLDLFFEGEFAFRRSLRSELHLLTEVVVRETHAPLRKDLALLETASYWVQLIEVATETETPIPEVAILLEQALRLLPLARQPSSMALGFELQLLLSMGVLPSEAFRGLPAGADVIADTWQREGLGACARTTCTVEQGGVLLRRLGAALQDHAGRLPRGRAERFEV